RRRRWPRRAFEAHAGGPGRRSLCRRILPDHPYPVQQHQSLARRHSSRRQRQAPAALSSGMVLPVQPPQFARRVGRLPHSARRRMRHHHLRSAQDRHHARRRQPCPAASRGGCATCSGPIGIIFYTITDYFSVADIVAFPPYQIVIASSEALKRTAEREPSPVLISAVTQYINRSTAGHSAIVQRELLQAVFEIPGIQPTTVHYSPLQVVT